MNRFAILLILSICAVSCSKKIVTPGYIFFENSKDSIFVYAKNTMSAPYQVLVEKNNEAITDAFILSPKDTTLLLKFESVKIDTLQILEQYSFKTAYGDPNMTSYDSIYNYQLPFPKHKNYNILQGNSTNFTHNNDFSRYALDFRMPIGDTICAARNGYVVGITEKHSKHGTDKSYRDYANYLTICHDDGTFSQYVHLDKNGALVEVNDYVEVGQSIAISGHTGWSTEPHLHFAVFKVKPFEFVSVPIIINSKRSTDYQKWELTGHD